MKALQVCTSVVVTPVVKFLLEHGADANAQNHPDSGGDAPLHIELRRLRTCSVDVIEELVRAGAVVRSCPPPVQTATDRFLFWHSQVTKTNVNKESPLGLTLRATQKGPFWVRAARALLEHGATWEPQRCDHSRRTQMHHIVAGAAHVATTSGDWHAYQGAFAAATSRATVCWVDPFALASTAVLESAVSSRAYSATCGDAAGDAPLDLLRRSAVTPEVLKHVTEVLGRKF